MALAIRNSSATAVFLAVLLSPLQPLRGQEKPAAKWPDERRIGPFICHADFNLNTCAGPLNELVELQRDVAQALELPHNVEPVHLFLFGTEQTYRDYIHEFFPNVPYRRALFIKERGPGMVFAFASKELDVDLRHESTHAILHAALPMVPLWLDEGLAEYFEVPAADRVYGNPHLPKLKWGMLLHNTVPLKRLESTGRIEDMGISQYRSSWAWVHFMLHGPPEAREELAHYLGDTANRTPPGLLSDRLAQRIPDLETKFSAHFSQWNR